MGITEIIKIVEEINDTLAEQSKDTVWLEVRTIGLPYTEIKLFGETIWDDDNDDRDYEDENMENKMPLADYLKKVINEKVKLISKIDL